MAETIFPYVGLPMSLLLLSIGGMILWDLLAAYGRTRDPDVLAQRSPPARWLLTQGRLGQTERPQSVGALWWRLVIVLALGSAMLSYWFSLVVGT